MKTEVFHTFKGSILSRARGLDLDLGSGLLHAVVHHSSTSTYMPNFFEIEETFCGRTDVRTHGRTFETGFIRSTLPNFTIIDIVAHCGRKPRYLPNFRSLGLLYSPHSPIMAKFGGINTLAQTQIWSILIANRPIEGFP